MSWEPLPLGTRLRWFGPGTRLVVRGLDADGAEHWLAVEVDPDADGSATLRHAPLFARPSHTRTTTLAETDPLLVDAVAEATGITPIVAATAVIAWPGDGTERTTLELFGSALSMALGVGLVLALTPWLAQRQPDFFAEITPLALVVFVTILGAIPAAAFQRLGVGPHLAALGRRLLSRAGHLPPTLRNASGFRLTEAQARYQLPLPPAPVGPTPTERVERIKAAYGALLTDVPYRIENSALFDAAVPQTQRFQVALLLWQDAETSGASPADLASEVEESFALARAEAERRGLAHLPESARGPARTATKASRVALAATTAGEREAGARQAAEILGSLALYYLPVIDPGAPSLLGTRRAIEP